MKTMLLNASDLKKLVSMKEVVRICQKTFQGLGDGTVTCPPKVNLNLGDSAPYPPYNASMNAMPAYIGWLDIAGLKWAGGFGGGRMNLQLPFINAMILLCEPNFGNFLAAMDGTWITNMRTGGQTAATLHYLLPEKKEISLGIYGAGTQGRMQVVAISQIFDIKELRIYDIVPTAAERFRDEMLPFVNGEIVLCEKPESVAQVDVVISVTLAKDGFIKSEWIHPSTLYFAMGSYQECDYATILTADYIVVDHVQQCLHRGALKQLAEQGRVDERNIYCTIGDLAAHKKRIEISGKRIVCIPIGTGALDVAVAGVAYQKAIALSVGSEYSFDC